MPDAGEGEVEPAEGGAARKERVERCVRERGLAELERAEHGEGEILGVCVTEGGELEDTFVPIECLGARTGLVAEVKFRSAPRAGSCCKGESDVKSARLRQRTAQATRTYGRSRSSLCTPQDTGLNPSVWLNLHVVETKQSRTTPGKDIIKVISAESLHDRQSTALPYYCHP